MQALDVNTTSKYSTHFLRAVELIKNAREEYNVSSENWPHPTQHRFGIPNDNYYAELWVDGMDWQPSYWVIEEYGLKKPEIQPFMIFNHHEERNRFNSWDFEDFVKACLYYRRDSVWVHSGELSYTDTIWPFFFMFKDELRNKKTKLYSFQHASQPLVVFWMNEDFIPEVYRGRWKSNRNNWDEKTGHGNRVQTNSR